MKMKNWIPKKTFLMVSATAAVFCVVLYLASLFLVLLEIKEIEDYYNNTESQSGKEERARVLKSIAETNKEYIQTLREYFIQKGDEVKFIEQIEEIGKKSSIQFEINSIDVKPNQLKNFKEDITVRMDIEGSWQNIMNFTDMLEKMNFGILVQNISLDAKTEAKWSGTIEFIIFREI
ncbi:MAG: hypothetical protein UT61_C0054G0008 [Candidatus Woesebacteria bacterium GW2011_GWA1_39_8]|uniref:Uncharacterized protein n=1 Tax=Candidatus Woesebacteria bacterium GW2011_GWA1_39_8 TaxID=1618552 RepID=A0A0G0PT42_9BACT|nr:MAG: hypothetical protein UT61_C0054G0008 [Candidatus Woesebacteria bacterium GW2011_GWA1_39_8]